MFAKTVILCAVVAVAAAITPYHIATDGQLALGAQSEHTVRGFGGLSSVSKQAKTVNSPYSTSSQSDVRVTNAAAYPAYAGHAYAAPYHHAQAYAAPVAYHHAPAYAPHAYHAAPVAHPVHHGYAAHPVHHGYAAPVAKVAAHPAGLLGVAYSPASAVATSSFSGFGVHYGY